MNSVLDIPRVSKVTATEFKQNLSLYLSKASEEDIAITSHGKVVAVLVSPGKED